MNLEKIQSYIDEKTIKVSDTINIELLKICDPKEINNLAFKDQDDMIEGYGGIEKAKQLGANAATPPPKL
jgi:choline-sulfatase